MYTIDVKTSNATLYNLRKNHLSKTTDTRVTFAFSVLQVFEKAFDHAVKMIYSYMVTFLTGCWYGTITPYAS